MTWKCKVNEITAYFQLTFSWKLVYKSLANFIVCGRKTESSYICRMSGVLYEEIFDIKSVDPEGKQFERVKRIHAECESSKMELILDVNSMLYNPSEGDKVS